MGYAIIDNNYIGIDVNSNHIYNADIISNIENGIIIRIGGTSLCQEIYVDENLREQYFHRNPTTLIASDIGVSENYSWHLICYDNNYIGYAEENDIIMLSAFIGETVCPDCLERIIQNILRREGE
ncbi:hypothetical protein [Brachyspira sp.]|uniref:hypothetical protein n=1 Tax=Brachyspira sp. TaxID=1977261 RepID=UPI003D7D48B4